MQGMPTYDTSKGITTRKREGVAVKVFSLSLHARNANLRHKQKDHYPKERSRSCQDILATMSGRERKIVKQRPHNAHRLTMTLRILNQRPTYRIITDDLQYLLSSPFHAYVCTRTHIYLLTIRFLHTYLQYVNHIPACRTFLIYLLTACFLYTCLQNVSQKSVILTESPLVVVSGSILPHILAARI